MALEHGGQNILAVTHGGFMWELRHELEKRGFSGDRFRMAENGQVYIFENHIQLPKPAPEDALDQHPKNDQGSTDGY